MTEDRGYEIAQFDEIAALQCSCGATRRAFVSAANGVTSIHRLDLRINATPHYHKKMTEVYYVLEGEGAVEINGQDVPVKRGTAVMIKPGSFHCGKGKMRLLVICIPAYSDSDEFFD